MDGRFQGDLAVLHLEKPHVRHEVAGARRWILRPCRVRLQLLHPHPEIGPVVVEIGHAVGLGVFEMQVLDGDGPSNRHPVMDVVGDQSQPVAEAPIVEQCRLVVEELFDLVLQSHPLREVGRQAGVVLRLRGQRHDQIRPTGDTERVASSSCQSRARIHSPQHLYVQRWACSFTRVSTRFWPEGSTSTSSWPKAICMLCG